MRTREPALLDDLVLMRSCGPERQLEIAAILVNGAGVVAVLDDPSQARIVKAKRVGTPG